jgi:hypothetical protein
VDPLRLVISSGHNRPDGSGLFHYDGSAVRVIDVFPSAGLATYGSRLYRVSPLRQGDGAEILVYDERGIRSYLRIDDVGDPHDVLALDETRLLCVSSRDNAIVSIAPDGTVAPYWKVDAPVDAWHVNCLARHDDRLFATAFGKFDTFRGWHPTRGAGSGILFDVESGEIVVAGLSQPHTPRWIDGAWVVCNSRERTVVRVEANGSRFAVPVGGFSRGLCAIGDRVYAGVSTPRESIHAATSAWIAVIDRERWAEIDRIPLPCGGMYDLIEVNEGLLRGLDAGFRVGSERERYFGQLSMFEQLGVTPQRVWAVANPLPPELCRVNITANIPATIALGDVARVRCRVENTGDGFLVSAAPHPVEVCYRWFDEDGVAAGEGTWLHTRLPRVLTPRDSAEFEVLIGPPPLEGRFTVRLTLLQEGVQWFDEVDPANAAAREVEIVAARET